MKLLVAGSRSIVDSTSINEKLEDYNKSNGPITEIVSGGARGPDRIAASWGHSKNIPVTVFYPNWNLLGKCAGMVRNKEMAEYADVAICFWDGKSNGTRNTIEEMRKCRKPIEVIVYGDLYETGK